MHNLDEDSSKSKRYWLREWRSAIGPCLICFGIPLLIPGITITLVGFSYTQTIATYSALHIIGFIFLAGGALCVVLGIVFLILNCSCFNKVSPSRDIALRHVTTHDTTLSKTSAGAQETPSTAGGTSRRTPATSTPRAITTNGRTPRETTRVGMSVEAEATTSQTAAIRGGQSPAGVAAAVSSSMMPGEVMTDQGSPPERPKSTKSSATGTRDSSEDSPTSSRSTDRGTPDWESSSDSGTSAGLSAESDGTSMESSTGSGDTDSATGSLTRSVGPITLPDLSSVTQTVTTARTLQSHVNFMPSPPSSTVHTARSVRAPPITAPPVSTVIGDLSGTSTPPPSPLPKTGPSRPKSPEFGKPEPLLRSGLDRPVIVQGLVEENSDAASSYSDDTSASADDATSASTNDDSEEVTSEKRTEGAVIDFVH